MKKFLSILFLTSLFACKVSAVVTVLPANLNAAADTAYCQFTYSKTFTATGGTTNIYHFTVSAGALPTGMTLDSISGKLSGTVSYTTNTTASFTIKARQTTGSISGTRAYTMYIRNKIVSVQELTNLWSGSQPPTRSWVYTTWYNTYLRSTGGAIIPSSWLTAGNTSGTNKKLGTTDSTDVIFYTNNVVRGRFYANGNGFNAQTAYYLGGSKFAYFPASATGNTSIGVGAGNNSTGSSFSTNVGALSLANNTSGDNISVFGYEAGRLNTTGANNTYLGYRAGKNGTTSGYNTFIGATAGQSITTGNLNTVIGANAMPNGTTTEENTFIGVSSGASSTTSYYNVGVGNQTLQNCVGCNLNTVVGRNSGQSITSGFENSFFGASSGAGTTTGVYNTFLGLKSGVTVTTGSNNTIVGWQMANTGSLTTGSGNTLVGSNYQPDANITNNVIITDGAGVVKFRATDTNTLVNFGSIAADSTGLPSGSIYRGAAGALFIKY